MLSDEEHDLNYMHWKITVSLTYFFFLKRASDIFNYLIKTLQCVLFMSSLIKADGMLLYNIMESFSILHQQSISEAKHLTLRN